MSAERPPVLIAYDGSDAAKAAVRAAAELFESRRGLVVTVWEPSLAYAAADLQPAGPELSPIPVDIQAAHEAEEALEVTARRTAAEGADLAREAGLECDALAVAERVRVADALVELARKREAGAIVVGSRGLTGIRARLEGSTSSAVLKQADCPVVVVHDD